MTIHSSAGDARNFLFINDGLTILHDRDCPSDERNVVALPFSWPARLFRRGSEETKYAPRAHGRPLWLGIVFDLDFIPAAQLNSMCNLKSSNSLSVISSGPCPGLTSVPLSTFHFAVALGSLAFHPFKSLPLNSDIAFPHFGSPFRFSDGALSPVHCHGVPSCPVVVPTSVFPDSLPSNTMSSFLSSSSFGETNIMWSCAISTFGSGRACPQRLTIRALSCPP